MKVAATAEEGDGSDDDMERLQWPRRLKQIECNEIKF